MPTAAAGGRKRDESGNKGSGVRRSGRRLSLDLAAGGGGGGGGKTRLSERQDERALLRMRALPCEQAQLVAIEEHSTEERMRRRKLRPSADLPRRQAAVASGAVTDTAGASLDPSIGPWSGAGVDLAAGKLLGSSRVISCDAKCIDEP